MPAKRTKKMDPALTWLLGEDQPAIRYLAMTELLGTPKDDADVLTAKGRIAEVGWAAEILAKPWRVAVHYCSSGYKDGWQLRTRIKRRAETVARAYDEVTEDGTLVKGVIEADDLASVERELRQRYRVPAELVAAVPARNRVEVAPWVLEEIAAKLPWPSFVVEEYPTADALEVERQRLPGL